MVFRLSLFSLAAVLFLSSCAGISTQTDDKTPLDLKPARFSDLKGWGNDDMQGMMSAYRASCTRILKKSADADFMPSDKRFGTYRAWQSACRTAQTVDANNPAAVRSFFEDSFDVMQASAAGNTNGLFTGYYESTLHGSRTRGGVYQTPLLGMPDDLVMVDLGEFRPELKGQRIAGRVKGNKLKPYEDRAAIVAGKLPPAQMKPLVWLDNPYDAFFVQVQGSGTVHLAEGGTMRLGYAGQNGHPYKAIGRELVARGIYSKDEVSMESIRLWMTQTPESADDLMNSNPSYVFFSETTDAADKQAGPKGAEGVSLTAQRSLAIDHAKIPYGLPVFLDVTYNDEAQTPIRRLMMAQDTGGAIRGAVRGDFFWGGGARAEQMAGPMKARGGYYFLIPKGL